MNRTYLIVGALMSCAGSASAQYDICADLGADFTWGISSFGAAEGWLVDAHDNHGIDWSTVYIYLDGVTDDREARAGFIELKVNEARGIGAIPVMTLYQMLLIADQNGASGAETERIRTALESPDMMRQYFEAYTWLLDTFEAIGGNILLHVEPDTWGFMMWGLGIEGNSDASSVRVMVGSSGFPEVEGMDDDAGSFGRALVGLRDSHAPNVRLGWHASNFRVGTRPEVVSGFFSSMGDWDVLVSESPRIENSDLTWWEPWPAQNLDTHLNWLSTVSSDAGLPILLWQLPIGTTDYHMLEEPGDYSVLERFANAGVIGGMYSLRGESGQDPDTFRDTEGEIGAVPPSDSPAGGTAAHMRERLTTYYQSPFRLPADSICGSGMLEPGSMEPPDGGNGSTTEPSDGGGSSPPEGGEAAGGQDGSGSSTRGGDGSGQPSNASGGGSPNGGASGQGTSSNGGRASAARGGSGSDTTGSAARATQSDAGTKGGCALASAPRRLVRHDAVLGISFVVAAATRTLRRRRRTSERRA